MPTVYEFHSRESGYMCAGDVPAGSQGVVVKIAKYKKAKLRGKPDNNKDKDKDKDKPKGQEQQVSRVALLLVDSANKPRFTDCDGNELWMPLNVTNRDILVDLLGTDELDEFVGRVICIYQAIGNAFGKQAAMIKVKKSLPQQDPGPMRRGAPSNAKAAPKADAKPPAADRPPIDTNNDASQTYLPPEPPESAA